MIFSAFLFPLLAVASVLDSAPSDIEQRDLISSLVSQIWNQLKNTATCTGCEGVLGLLKGIADLGDTIFVEVLTEICVLVKLEDADVCQGSIGLEGPIIASDLRSVNIGSKTSQLMCTTFFGLCDYPPVSDYSIQFPTPKPAGSCRPAPSGQKPIRIVHYSDIHVDPQYQTGASDNCTKPICCRSYDAAHSPGNNKNPAGPNGDHNCDAPVTLEQSMYNAIKEIVPDAAFVLFTGDIVDHAVWETTQAQNTRDINDAYNRMLGIGNIVYGTIGNHEMSPTNAFQTIAEGNDASWVYDQVSTDWTPWIGPSAASSVQNFGAYATVYPHGNLKVISLNTNFYYTQNYWLFSEPMEQDPSGQFAWLVGELDSSEKAGQRVYIIGHMPLGDGDAFHDGSHVLDQIINRYSDTITALFFGHTHTDSFQLSYSDYSNQNYQNAVATSYIVPSMTPTSGMPAFRVYTVDPVTFAVLDSITYVADMEDPAYQTTGPVWGQYYSAVDAYSQLVTPHLPAGAELSPAFWHNVTAYLSGNQTAFNAYYARKSRGWAVNQCTGQCAINEICQLRAARSENNCVTPTPGVHFTKRDQTTVTSVRDECGISVAREVLGTIATSKDVLHTVVSKLHEAKR